MTVIDAVGGVQRHRRVVFAGDRILAVGDASSPHPRAARVIDGRGKFLIPGLWDMHVHLTFTPALSAEMPRLFLAHGITSVRDTGGPIDELVAIRERYRSGTEPAPRLYFSGPLLDGAFVVYDGGDPGRPAIGTPIPDVATAERRIAELAARGVDFVKIYEMVDADVFDALVRAATLHELPVAAHLPLAIDARKSAPSLDSLEHLRNIDLACAGDAAARLSARQTMIADYAGTRGYPLRSRIHSAQRLPAIAAYDSAACHAVIAALAKTTQVPTLRLNAFRVSRPFERDDWWAALARVSAQDVREDWEQSGAQRRAELPEDPSFSEWSLRLVGMLHAAGVPIGAGTDTPIHLSIPGYSLHTELELLVRAGLSPLEALASATLVPARFFGLDDEMGAIEAGRRADMVLLDANPLRDISNTRRIAGVVTRGRWLARAELEALVEPDL